jgi:hypothetical protein
MNPGAPTPVESDAVIIRTHRIGDVGWAIERHALLYAATSGMIWWVKSGRWNSPECARPKLL